MRRQGGRFLTLTLVVVVGAAVASAQQQSSPPPPQDSIAEAARKAKAERAKNKARMVYSEDDLSTLSNKNISVVGQEAAPAPASAPEEGKGPDAHSEKAPKPKTEVRDEAYWRDRAGKLRDQIATLDAEIAKLKETIKQSGGAGFDAQSGLSENVIYFQDRSFQLQKLEDRRKVLQKQMDDLEAEARKAGVPPGWLR